MSHVLDKNMQTSIKYLIAKFYLGCLHTVYSSHTSHDRNSKVLNIYCRSWWLFTSQTVNHKVWLLPLQPTDCGPLPSIDTFLHAPAPRSSQVLLVSGFVTPTNRPLVVGPSDNFLCIGARRNVASEDRDHGSISVFAACSDRV